jgi:hypothetical protein
VKLCDVEVVTPEPSFWAFFDPFLEPEVEKCPKKNFEASGADVHIILKKIIQDSDKIEKIHLPRSAARSHCLRK